MLDMQVLVVAAKFYKGQGTWNDGNPRMDNVVFWYKSGASLDALPQKCSLKPGNIPLNQLQGGQPVTLRGYFNNGRFYPDLVLVPAKAAA